MKTLVPSAVISIMERLSFGVYRNGPLASPWTSSCPAPTTLWGLARLGKEEAGVGHQHSLQSTVLTKMFNGKVWTNQRLRQS